MAVRTRDDVTLATITDVTYTRRFYVLQGSTAATPAQPTTNPPGGAWATTEPGYTEGSTNSLYTVDLTVFSDGTFDYSLVSKSSSYEAAKAAYNKAVAAAGTAQAAADAVLTMSGSKTQVYYSTAAASGTSKAEGDLWRQIDSAKNVIAEWYWTGKEWQQSQITTSAIANLDVGKLTAGTAVLKDVVAQKIAAGTADIQTVNAANLFVTGEAAFKSAVVEKFWAEVVKAKMVTAEQFIGENAILTGAVTTEKLSANAIDGMTVTGAVVQTHADANKGGKFTSGGLIGYNKSGTPVTSIDFETGVLSAQGAKISGDISGSRMIGGYIEAPVIASSEKLGSGANVLTDPDLTGTINTAWVASGHTGDADPTQTDTVAWDQSWKQYSMYPVTDYTTCRNFGNLVIDSTFQPVTRRAGTVTFSNRAFLDTAARSLSNPFTFKDRTYAQSMGAEGQSAGANDPSISAANPKALKAETAKTSYLTNAATIPFKTGEPWALRLEHAALGAKAKYVSATVEVVRASDSVVVWSRAITADELFYGTPISDSVVPTVTQNVKLRIKAVYTAASGGFVRKVRSGYSRQIRGGAEATASVVNATGWGVSIFDSYYTGAPTSYLVQNSIPWSENALTSKDAATRAILEHANVHWYITSAQLSQVTPEKGWSLDKESGLRLFNANGAQTGAINGEENFLAGTFATNPTGKRTELDGDYVTWYDANNQPIKRIGPTTSETWSGGQWTNDDSGWIKVGSVVNGVTIGYHAGWSHYDDSAVPWNGLWFRRKNGQVTITGASRHAGWGNLSPVFTLPAGWGPGTTVQGTNCDVRAAGQLVTSGSGSIAMSFHALFPVAN